MTKYTMKQMQPPNVLVMQDFTYIITEIQCAFKLSPKELIFEISTISSERMVICFHESLREMLKVV